jgi:transcription initiation factor TFIIB
LLGDSQIGGSTQGRCSFCSGDLLLDYESGENVCTVCGIVSSVSTPGLDELYALSGSRSIAAGSDRSMTLAEQVGAATVIGIADLDAKGRRISQGRDLKQLRRLDTMVTWDSKKRRLRKVSMQIRRISQSLGMSDIIAERGFEIYKREYGVKSPRAKSLAAVAAAALCAACRELDVARPANDVVALHAGVNKKQLRRYYKLIVSEGASREVLSPISYVSSMTAKVGLKGTTERIALDILAKVKGDPKLVGKRPVSIAAAALYLASVRGNDRTTQLRLAYASGVTPITIRKRSIEISHILEQQ